MAGSLGDLWSTAKEGMRLSAQPLEGTESGQQSRDVSLEMDLSLVRL